MAELTVDLTYGTALAEAARETGREKEIMEDGFGLLEIMKAEPDFDAFVKFPGISADDTKRVITEILEGKVCKELLNFLYVLIDKRRIGSFAGIMKVYKDILEKEEGVSYGTVYTVIKLDEQRLAQIEEETAKLLQTKVKLENEIDESLLAGFKILVDGKIIDASYRKKFDEMANQMKLS